MEPGLPDGEPDTRNGRVWGSHMEAGPLAADFLGSKAGTGQAGWGLEPGLPHGEPDTRNSRVWGSQTEAGPLASDFLGSKTGRREGLFLPYSQQVPEQIQN